MSCGGGRSPNLAMTAEVFVRGVGDKGRGRRVTYSPGGPCIVGLETHAKERSPLRFCISNGFSW